MESLDELKTLTGFTMREVLREMVRVLPPAAYKAVGNNNRFTDINPAYLTEVATRVFGPVGIGWKYDYNDIHVENTVEKTRTNEERAVTYADIYLFSLYYAYVDSKGEMHWSEPILSTGGSKNSDRGHAVRGAVTNAIGAAFSKLLWQLRTYKGIVTHTNAREYYAKQKAADEEKKIAGNNGNGAHPSLVKTEEAEEEEIVTDAEVEHNEEDIPETEPAPALEAESKEESKTVTGELPITSDETLKLAYQTVIPDGIGVPMAGRTFEEIKADIMNEKILTYLAGEREHNKTKKLFAPIGVDEKRLAESAKLVLQDLRSKGVIAKPRKKAA